MMVSNKPDHDEFLQCEKHGQYQVRYIELVGRFMKSEACPECIKEKDKEDEDRRKKESEEAEAKRLAETKNRSGISVRNHWIDFDSFITDTEEKKKAKQKAEQFTGEVIDGGSGCLIMVGNVGAGKTMLATAIADKVIRAKKRCCIVKVIEIIREIKDSWRKDSESTESGIIDFYSSVRLLILDEVGVQYGSDTEKLMLFEIIDNRYQNMLPTVLVSNLDVEGVKQCIGDRVYDRLRDDGGKVIAFTWGSMRGQANKQGNKDA